MFYAGIDFYGSIDRKLEDDKSMAPSVKLLSGPSEIKVLSERMKLFSEPDSVLLRLR